MRWRDAGPSDYRHALREDGRRSALKPVKRRNLRLSRPLLCDQEWRLPWPFMTTNRFIVSDMITRSMMPVAHQELDRGTLWAGAMLGAALVVLIIYMLLVGPST